MKKLNVIFTVINALLVISGLAHMLYSYFSILSDPSTGVPAYVAVFILIPYFLGTAVCCIAWLISFKIYKRLHKQGSRDKL